MPVFRREKNHLTDCASAAACLLQKCRKCDWSGLQILKHAQLEACLRPGSLYLNFARVNISILWHGYSDLKLCQRQQKLRTHAKMGLALNSIFNTLCDNDLLILPLDQFPLNYVFSTYLYQLPLYKDHIHLYSFSNEMALF